MASRCIVTGLFLSVWCGTSQNKVLGLLGNFEGLVGHNSQHRARNVVLTQDSIQVKHKLGNTGKYKHRYEMVPAFKMVVGGNTRPTDKEPLNKP